MNKTIIAVIAVLALMAGSAQAARVPHSSGGTIERNTAGYIAGTFVPVARQVVPRAVMASGALVTAAVGTTYLTYDHFYGDQVAVNTANETIAFGKQTIGAASYIWQYITTGEMK